MHRISRLGSSVLPVVLLGLALGAGLTVGACGTPSIEARVQQYNKAKDRLDVLGTKLPHMKMDIQRKLLDFQKDFQAAKAKGGKTGSKAIGALISRMNAYEAQLNPQAARPTRGTATGRVGGKLGGGAAMRPGVQPGGKLGTAPSVRPMVNPAVRPTVNPAVRPTVNPAVRPTVRPAVRPMVKPSGKFGGAAAPAPTARPAAGGSGFGGK